MKTPADHNDAILILKLYELRRESVMRQARDFMLRAEFTTPESVLAVAADFAKQENAYFRQVVSYWEMAASFVNRGILSPELYADNCGEGLVVFGKLQPHLPALREGLSPRFLNETERCVDGYPVIREKFGQIQELLARLAP